MSSPRVLSSSRNTRPESLFLIATAKVFKLTLVAADDRLLKSHDVPLLANHQLARPLVSSPTYTIPACYPGRPNLAKFFILTKSRHQIRL